MTMKPFFFLKIIVIVLVFLIPLNIAVKAESIEQVSAQNLNIREKYSRTQLPDFWPDKEMMIDSTTLNIEWLSEEQVNGIKPLTEKHLYYDSHTGVRIHGVYIRPSMIPEGTTIPGMVLVHGGGYNHKQVYPLGKHIAETAGFGILCIDSPGVSSDQWSSSGYPETASSCTNVTDSDGPRGSFYYHNVIALLRGVTVLQSLPEINDSLVGLGGFSGGGIASLIANGVESRYQRLKFAVHLAVAGEWTEEFPQKSPVDWYGLDRESEKYDIFLQSYEPLKYATSAHAPSLMVCITNDRFFDLKQFQRTFKALPEGKKALSVHVGNDHWFLKYPETWEPVKTWCLLIANGEELYPTPTVDRVTQKANSISITLKQAIDQRIDEIGLIWNVDDLTDINSWNVTKQAIQEGQTTYTWTIDSGSAEEFSFYPAVFSDGLLLFSAPPIYSSEVKTSNWSILGVITAILPVKLIYKRKKINKSKIE